MLGQELQQLELLVGEVECAALQPGAVSGLVDGQVADVDAPRCRAGGAGAAVDGEPEPGVELGGACGVEDDVVDGPLGRQSDQPTLGEDGDDRLPGADGAEDARQRAGAGQVAPRVDQHQVAAGPADERGRI